MKYGDNYINVLSSAIKPNTNIREFNLANNRITLKSSDNLLKLISN